MGEKRTPFRYDGNHPTNKTLKRLLTSYMEALSPKEGEWREKFALAWQELVGETFAKMSEVKSFQGGILRIAVKSSQFLSLLHMKEKNRIEQILKTRFPEANLKGIALKLESLSKNGKV